MPAFALLLLGPTPGAGAIARLVLVLVLADVGVAVVGTLVGALAVQTRARDLIVPLLALPLLIPVVIARREGHDAAVRWPPARRRSRGAGWPSSVSMIWSSGSSPMRSSTTWSRTESPTMLYGTRLRALSILTAVTLTAGFALAVFYAPIDADQGFIAEDLLRARAAGDRRAVRVRLRRDHGHPVPAHRRLALRPALVRRDPPEPRPRRRRPDHRLDLGEGEPGDTGGSGTSRRSSRS